MSRTPPAFHLVHRARVTSTMDVLDELTAAGAAEWTVVLADEQTVGLGRAGRRWEAEPGTALLCSILLRPRAGAVTGGMLAIGTGVAVAEVLEDLGVEVGLKWPNDVLLDGRKLGGVLIRTSRDSAGLAVNVGIGLNLTYGFERTHDDRAAVSDVLSAEASPRALLPSLIAAIDRVFYHDDGSVIRDAWKRRAVFLDETVHVVIDGQPVVGRLMGIDEAGALEVEEACGTIHRVVAGDLARGPRLSKS